MKIAAPGIYGIPADAYHADPCPEPSLSSSIARVLLAASPRHAWCAHPRLNPEHEPKNRKDFDVGTAAHAVLLEDSEARFALIDADSYRTKAAQEARDAAYADGKTPLLPHQHETVREMAKAAKAQLAAHAELAGWRDGAEVERTLVWREDDIWCRARLDLVAFGRTLIADLKTTGGSAAPDQWCRNLFNLGYDVQAAFYLRGWMALHPGTLPPNYRLIVQETEPPYALIVLGLEPAVLHMADRKVQAVIDLWRTCIRTGSWPGYPAETVWPEAPPWAERPWLEREAREQAVIAAGKQPFDILNDWQRPL